MRRTSTLLVITTFGGVMIASGLLLLSCSDSPTPANSGFDASGAAPGTGLPQLPPIVELPPPPDTGAPPVCVSKEAEAVEGKRPVDIIFAIDNSSSMFEEIDEVEKQINDNFTKVLADGLADYRIIMLSKHGSHDPVNLVQQRICVKGPLSGSTCDPVPLRPVETPKFVHHSIVINSQDSWCKILTTFAGPDDNGDHAQGWGAFLRPTAFKVFAIISDDRINATCNVGTGSFTFDDKNDDVNSAKASANGFDSALLAMSPQFGTSANRNYVWHSIVGLAPYLPADTTKAHPFDAPLTKELCAPANPDAGAGALPVAAGLGYQSLSKLTGGLRYPTCGLNYTPIFQKMAQDVIGKTVVACDYAMPPNPDGGTIDPATTIVRYTSGSVVTDFEQVASVDACGANKFTVSGDRIRLCAPACTTVQSDAAAKIKILFGCLGKQSSTK